MSGNDDFWRPAMRRAGVVAGLVIASACTTSGSNGDAVDGGASVDARPVGDVLVDGAEVDLALPEPELSVEERVIAAVASDCSAVVMDALAGATPALVREALVAVDARQKATSWVSGVSHGHPIPATCLTPLLADFEFEYSLFVPEGYRADPAAPLPLYVDPAHPTDALESDRTLPWLASLAGRPFLMVTVNFYNRLSLELSEQDYRSDALASVRGHHDYFVALDAVVADVRRKYYVDSARIYAGGVSAVGNSAWFHAIFSADQYAAINPYSAGTAPFDEGLYRNLVNTAVLAVHGTEDDLVPLALVRSTIETLAGWGFDAELWAMEGEGHGTMFSAVLPEAVPWMLERRRSLTPSVVHKAVKDSREVSAWWVRVTEVSAPLPPDGSLYPSPAPAVIDATWSDGEVRVETQGVARFELLWLQGDLGPGRAMAGDALEVVVNGSRLGPFTLEEDATVAVEDYCRRADISRSWAGRVRLEVP